MLPFNGHSSPQTGNSMTPAIMPAEYTRHHHFGLQAVSAAKAAAAMAVSTAKDMPPLEQLHV